MSRRTGVLPRAIDARREPRRRRCGRAIRAWIHAASRCGLDTGSGQCAPGQDATPWWWALDCIAPMFNHARPIRMERSRPDGRVHPIVGVADVGIGVQSCNGDDRATPETARHRADPQVRGRPALAGRGLAGTRPAFWSKQIRVPLIPRSGGPIRGTLGCHERRTGPEQRRHRPPQSRTRHTLPRALLDERARGQGIWVLVAERECNVSALAGAEHQDDKNSSEVLSQGAPPFF
jgi:hypothetical protein